MPEHLRSSRPEPGAWFIVLCGFGFLAAGFVLIAAGVAALRVLAHWILRL